MSKYIATQGHRKGHSQRTLADGYRGNSWDARSQSFRGWKNIAEELADLVLVGDLIISHADCLYVPDICSHACQSMDSDWNFSHK